MDVERPPVGVQSENSSARFFLLALALLQYLRSLHFSNSVAFPIVRHFLRWKSSCLIPRFAEGLAALLHVDDLQRCDLSYPAGHPFLIGDNDAIGSFFLIQ